MPWLHQTGKHQTGSTVPADCPSASTGGCGCVGRRVRCGCVGMRVRCGCVGMRVRCGCERYECEGCEDGRV